MSVAKPILEYVKTIKTQAEILRSTSTFRRFLKYHRPYLRLIAVTLGLTIFAAYLFSLEPLYTAQIVDQVITQGKSELLLGLVLNIVFAVVAFGIVNFFMTYMQGYLAQMVTRDVRSDYYSSLQRKSFRFYDASAVGDLVSRATMDVQAVEAFVKTWLGTLFNAMFVIVIAFVIMYSVNPVMSLIAIAPMPLIFYFTSRLWIKTMPLFRKMMLILGKLGAYIQQNIIGMKVVRIFRREDELDQGFKQVEQEFVDTAINAGRIQSKYMPSGPAILTLGITIVYLYGGNLIAAPLALLTIGQLTLFSRYMMRLSFPLRDLSMLSGTWINASAGLERIYEMMDIPADVEDPENTRELTIEKGTVEFDNVTFGYATDRPVLKNVTFKVNAGERIAILGATGSGKTSLVYLIPRFYDVNAGRILIDGKDAKSYKISSLRRQIGLVLQDVFIFTGTIKDNIAFGQPEARMDDIVSAAKLARIHDFIMTLPDGYDTIVGERGVTLSGGQRQRITIARALLTKPKILILDDALSFVDAKTEKEIQEALEEAMKGKTSFIIAQRLSTIKNADRIMVLDSGVIVEFGTHNELMAKDNVYRRVYETQFLEKAPKYVLEAGAE
ncbi:ABC transporter ATP-binding protein/permease [Candidatus Bathyarchaeota archaeon]|nr:ABC transporter ATP-binding protein/permease [Candidatus Bathyarchaeota archaeon]